MINEVPLIIIECFERRVKHYICGWLGLSLRLCSIAVYVCQNMLRSPFSTLGEEFRVGHTQQVLQYL